MNSQSMMSMNLMNSGNVNTQSQPQLQPILMRHNSGTRNTPSISPPKVLPNYPGMNNSVSKVMSQNNQQANMGSYTSNNQTNLGVVNNSIPMNMNRSFQQGNIPTFGNNPPIPMGITNPHSSMVNPNLRSQSPYQTMPNQLIQG